MLIRSRPKGEGYIDTVVVFLTFVLCLVVIINLFPVFTQKAKLDHFATELAREIEVAGDTSLSNTTVAARIEDLTAATGLAPTITVAADTYFSGTKIQMGTAFTVTCASQYALGGNGGLDLFTIGMSSRATGRSEAYWK